MLTWLTPKGHIFTATEMVSTSTYVAVAEPGALYSKINGRLPEGLVLTSSGIIAGVPAYVLGKTTSQFTIRATDGNDFSDRDFSIDVDGSDTPVWETYTITTGTTTGTLTTSTITGYLAIGVTGEPYALYKQWVDYQLIAKTVEAPSTATIKYLILPGDGVLPAGLTLTDSGRITGFISTYNRDELAPSENCFTNVVYDIENWTTSTSTASVLVTGGFQIYSFFVTAFDGVKGNRRLFKILSVNPDTFRASSAYLPTTVDILDYSILSSSVSYLQPTQLINPTNLGKIKVSNNVYLASNSYDPAPNIGPLTYSINTISNTISELPANLILNSKSGRIYGYVNDQKEFRKSFTVTIDSTKSSVYSSEIVTATNTFTFIVQNGPDDIVKWVNTGSLGTILPNEISEFYVEATTSVSSLNLKYVINNGSLPPGLSLNRDGTISGKVPINVSTATTTTNFNFNVAILDNNDNLFITGDFSITVNKTTATDFTSIWCRPYFAQKTRNLLRDSVLNNKIFEDEDIYRPLDPNFGLQRELKMFIDCGVEKKNMADYVATLNQNFYKRRFQIGIPKVAIAKQNNIVLHEMIYLDILDNLVNDQNESVSKTFIYNGISYYPASVYNMRERIRELHTVTDNLNPKIINGLPTQYGKKINFIKYIPLCFVKPNTSKVILRKIQDTNIKFNSLDFEVDRIFVQEQIGSNDPHYLIFQN